MNKTSNRQPDGYSDLMLNIDYGQTEWMERYEDDFVIAHNPKYKFQHHHPYRSGWVVVVVCEGGTASGSINLTPYSLKAGDLLIVLSGHIMESFEASDDFRGTNIFMSERFLEGLEIGDSYRFYQSVNDTPCHHLEGMAGEGIQSYINMVHSMLHLAGNTPNVRYALQLLTKTFFLMLGWFLHGEDTAGKDSARHSDATREFVSLVKAHYRQHRDVEYYASRMNITSKYLSAMVKKASGKSALHMIEEHVILDAKAQLSSTQNTIQQVAYDLNFPSQTFFTRYFKRATGQTPSDYRREMQLNRQNTAPNN